MKKLAVSLLFVTATVILLYTTVYANGGTPAGVRELPGYSVPKDIIITQPADNTVTASPQISILGAGNPVYPLYMNGVEKSKTESGFFAQYVRLKDGENTFTFKNNGGEKTITIIKSDVVEITYSEPKYGVINRNYPTRRAKPDEDVNLLTPLAKGTAVKILGEAEDYYKIGDGTYVYKVALDISNGKLPVNMIAGVKVNEEGDFTYVKYTMNINALYDISLSENKAVVAIHAAGDKSGAPDVGGTRITNASKRIDEGKAVYEFTLSEKPLGYYVTFNDGEMTVAFMCASKGLTGSLAGKTIVLDAGHGGGDPGAFGPLRGHGPVEKDFNLYVTLATAEYLESRGARVLLTRGDDTFIELADRVSFILDAKPDISVSVHTNSRPVTQDFGGASGSMMYYTFDTGAEAAESIYKYIMENFQMAYIPPIKENFALTRITNCPAILFEMSFMSNPDDYEWLLKTDNLESMGKALGKGIENYLEGIIS